MLIDRRNESLVKNSFILGLGTIIPKILNVLVLPLLTSYLSTSEYGNYDLIVSMTSLIVPIISLQIQQAIFRFLLASINKSEVESYVSTSLAYIFIITLIFTPITYWLGMVFHLPNKVCMAICLFVMGECFYILIGQILRGIGENLNYSLGIITYSIVNVVFILIFVLVLQYGLFGIVLSNGVSYIVAAWLMYFFVTKKYCFRFSAINISTFHELVKFSAPIIPSSISLWIVNLSDRLIIVSFLGTAANGIYSVANKIPSLYTVAYNVFNLSWTETAVRVADEDADFGEYYSELFGKLFQFLIGVILLIISLTPVFYTVLINENYFDAYFQTAILFYGVFFNSIVSFYSGIYIALKKTKQVGLSSIVGAVINIIVNLILISKIGLYAASISTVCAYFSIAIYRCWDLKKYLNMKYQYKDIIVGMVCMVMSTVLYFQRNIGLDLISLVIAMVYNIIYNKYVLIWGINKVKRLFKK